MLKPKSEKKPARFETASEFESLPDDEKERIYQEIDSQSTEQLLAHSTALNAADRERHRKFLRKGKGRPMLGRAGVKVISLSVEKDLLQRADAYAKQHGLKRAEFFSQAIQRMLPRAG